MNLKKYSFQSRFIAILCLLPYKFIAKEELINLQVKFKEDGLLMAHRKVVLLLLISALFLISGLCRADWQPQQSNGYTWYEDNGNKAFPFQTEIGTADWYYQFSYPGQGVAYATPIPNADPRLDTWSYIFVDTASNQIWTRQDDQQWVYIQAPDLATRKKILDDSYSSYINSIGKNGDAYYKAKYDEAYTIYQVSRVIVARNG